MMKYLASTLTLLFALLCALSGPAMATDAELAQSFRSCSIITSERLTAMQFQQQGLSLEQLKNALPVNSPKAFERIRQIYTLIEQKGAVATYQILNLFYQECAQEVYDRLGKPPKAHPEHGFYLCAGENQLRAKVLAAQAQGLSLKEARTMVPEARHPMAEILFAQAAREGITTAYDESARQLKICLNDTLNISGP